MSPPLLPPSVPQTLAREFLHNPYQVIIGSADLKANHRISQANAAPLVSSCLGVRAAVHLAGMRGHAGAGSLGVRAVVDAAPRFGRTIMSVSLMAPPPAAAALLDALACRCPGLVSAGV